MTRLQVAGGRSRRAPVTGSGLLVCAPLRLEARALRRGLRSAGQETGQPRPARRQASRPAKGQASRQAQARAPSGSW